MDVSALNLFDAVILTVIFLSAVFAFMRGFVKTIFSLLCWTFSLACAVILAPYLVKYLEGVIESFYAVLLISYLGGFAIIFVLFAIIFGFIVKLAQPCCDRFIDRALGGALGFLRGAVVACLIFSGIQTVFATISPPEQGGKDHPGPDWLTEAQTYNFLKLSSSLMAEFMPDGMTGWAASHAEKLTRLAKITAPGQVRNGSKDDIDIELSEDYRNVFDAMVDGLPQETLDDIDKEYGNVSRKMLGAEGKLDFWSRVIAGYREDVFNGDILADSRVPEADVVMLENEISRLREDIAEIRRKNGSTGATPADAAAPVGYDDEKRDMMQRLVDQLQQPDTQE